MPDTNIITPPVTETVGIRKVDVNRGALDGSVSSQWWTRPDDQRFLTLEALKASLEERKARSKAIVFDTADLQVRADFEEDDSLWAEYGGAKLDPTHWSFGQLCQRVTAPAQQLRSDVPGFVAALYVQARLQRTEKEQLGMMQIDHGDRTELRAITGPTYGRVWDADVAALVERITADGTWKVPGVINWNTGQYDPDAPITKQSTTLYASDRDVFIFMCRDQYPIEVGKLADGSPDYIFPGFIVANSEVGSMSLTLETMYLRGICQNRNLWGVEDKQTVRMRHSSGLPSRLVREFMPKLEDFSKTSASTVAAKVRAAKSARAGDDDGEVKEFLRRKGFGQQESKDILETVLNMEGRPARSIWDIVQGATARARDSVHQDARVQKERAAGALMDLIKV